jgi:WD40 repeat protein
VTATSDAEQLDERVLLGGTSVALVNRRVVYPVIGLMTGFVLLSPSLPAQAPTKALGELTGYTDVVHALAFSPDGMTLAGGGGPWRGSDGMIEPGELKLWDVRTKKELANLVGHIGPIYAVAFRPDGKTLAAGGVDRTVRLWDVATKKEKAVFRGAPGRITSVAFSPDGKTLAVAVGKPTPKASGTPGVVMLWDVEAGSLRKTLKGHSEPVTAVCFNPTGSLLCSASGVWDAEQNRSVSGEVKLWDPNTGEEQATLRGHSDSISALAMSPDGKTLATGSMTWHKKLEHVHVGEVKLWDLAARREQATIEVHHSWVESLAFSPDGKILASGSGLLSMNPKVNPQWWGGEVVLIDVRTRKVIVTLTGFDTSVDAVAFSPDGKILATHRDTGIKLWGLP